MLKKLMNMKKKKGFTLIELIVVLVIMAILAAAAIPTMMGYVDKAKASQYLAEGRAVYVAAQAGATEGYGKTTTHAPVTIGAVPVNAGGATPSVTMEDYIKNAVKDVCRDTNMLTNNWAVTVDANGGVTLVQYQSGTGADAYLVTIDPHGDATAEKGKTITIGTTS